MAVALQDRKRSSPAHKSWLDDVSSYEREFKKWEGRVEKIIKRYKDDGRTATETTRSRFNILWSNVQTLTAATFSRIPKPDVSRRFKDNDPVGRVASLILERDLDYHIQHYANYRSTLKADVFDRFLGGRGTAWVRYEPHFKASDIGADGAEITDDVDSLGETLDYECVAVDYVHWKDFGHSVARTWEEVNRVWRVVYMTKDGLKERFKDKAKLIPMDASPKEIMGSPDYRPGDAVDRAKIYEGWDKQEKKAVWFSKSLKDFLDERDDPLGLEEFFPCPRPLYATTTSDSLVPIPDFSLYQDQANSLDLLSDRIDGLINALKVMGVYDASIPEIGRLFTEGTNTSLMPAKNWAAFAEKNGLTGAIDLVDLTPIAKALMEAYKAMEQVKGQVYEVSGISDIVRGETDPNETLGAQQMKGQYASLRLKTYQEEVSRFATEILQLMAQVICGKFSPDTIAAIAAADQLSEADQQMLPQALELLVGRERMMDPEAPQGPNPLRQFRVEVAADTLVYLDEQTEKEGRVEFLTAVGGFFEKAAAVGAQAPQLVPLLMELAKFGIQGFKVGKNVEGTIDEAIEQLKKAAMNPPPPPPDPKLEAEKFKAQAAQQKAGLDVGVAKQKAQIEGQKMQGEQQHDQAKLAIDGQRLQMDAQRMEMERKDMAFKASLPQQQRQRPN